MQSLGASTTKNRYTCSSAPLKGFPAQLLWKDCFSRNAFATVLLAEKLSGARHDQACLQRSDAISHASTWGRASQLPHGHQCFHEQGSYDGGGGSDVTKPALKEKNKDARTPRTWRARKDDSAPNVRKSKRKKGPRSTARSEPRNQKNKKPPSCLSFSYSKPRRKEM